MKRLFSLAAILLLSLPAVTLAQTPEQIQKTRKDAWTLIQDLDKLAGVKATPCGCKAATLTADEQADIAEAVARGFGSRIAIGPFRECTLAVRDWRAGTAPTDPNDLTTRLGRTPRFTACQKATMAVIALEMTNSFSPGTIPPQVLALAIQMQQAACNTPVPPTPTKAIKLAEPTTVTIPLPPKQYPTGLILKPEAERKASHTREFLLHRAFHAKTGTVTFPASLDVRNVSTAIKDQGQCGSCYLHSYTECLEGANIKGGYLTVTQPLSVQFSLDGCGYSNYGCNGGDASEGFTWSHSGNGIPLDSVYGAYTGYSQGCKLSTTAAGYTDSDWGYCDSVTGVASVAGVKQGLNDSGCEVSVCIGADQPFMNYSGGVYTRDLSSGINHQVTIVGYKDDPTVKGGGYWILRNSWSTSWGEKGYARISYASNPTTEAMWVKAGKPVVIKPSVQPVPDTPTHRASVLLEKGARLNKTNPALIQKALKAAEDVLQTAP